MAPAPPPPPPKAKPSPIAPPPRVASPALSSRPSSPNFLSQSTRSTTRASTNATLNLSTLLADLDTLGQNPQLLKGKEFEYRGGDEQDYTPRKDSGRKSLQEVVNDSNEFPRELTREEAADLADEWLQKMETVLNKSDKVLGEQPGQGQRGRIDKLENWVGEVEKGLRDE